MRVADLIMQPSDGLVFGGKRLIELQGAGLLKQLSEKRAGFEPGLDKVIS
jgi:hypothetical protein